MLQLTQRDAGKKGTTFESLLGVAFQQRRPFGEELRMVGKEMIGDFEVEVFEDTYITAVHCKYGHKYSARWSTEVPHLRNEHCAPNDLAERDYKGFEDEAEQAMLRKLENDGLI